MSSFLAPVSQPKITSVIKQDPLKYVKKLRDLLENGCSRNEAIDLYLKLPLPIQNIIIKSMERLSHGLVNKLDAEQIIIKAPLNSSENDAPKADDLFHRAIINCLETQRLIQIKELNKLKSLKEKIDIAMPISSQEDRDFGKGTSQHFSLEHVSSDATQDAKEGNFSQTTSKLSKTDDLTITPSDIINDYKQLFLWTKRYIAGEMYHRAKSERAIPPVNDLKKLGYWSINTICDELYETKAPFNKKRSEFYQAIEAMIEYYKYKLADS